MITSSVFVELNESLCVQALTQKDGGSFVAGFLCVVVTLANNCGRLRRYVNDVDGTSIAGKKSFVVRSRRTGRLCLIQLRSTPKYFQLSLIGTLIRFKAFLQIAFKIIGLMIECCRLTHALRFVFFCFYIWFQGLFKCL